MIGGAVAGPGRADLVELLEVAPEEIMMNGGFRTEIVAGGMMAGQLMMVPMIGDVVVVTEEDMMEEETMIVIEREIMVERDRLLEIMMTIVNGADDKADGHHVDFLLKSALRKGDVFSLINCTPMVQDC